MSSICEQIGSDVSVRLKESSLQMQASQILRWPRRAPSPIFPSPLAPPLCIKQIWAFPIRLKWEAKGSICQQINKVYKR